MGMDPNSQNLSQDPHHAQNNVSVFPSWNKMDKCILTIFRHNQDMAGPWVTLGPVTRERCVRQDLVHPSKISEY